MGLKASLKSTLAGGGAALLLLGAAKAASVNIPGGDLGAALDAYTTQTGVSLIVSDGLTRGVHTNGVRGEMTPDEALSRILSGTGFGLRRRSMHKLTTMRYSQVVKRARRASKSPARCHMRTIASCAISSAACRSGAMRAARRNASGP